MPTPTYLDGDALHPDTEDKLYTVHFPSRSIHAASFTAVTATASGGASVSSASYANPGDAEHTAAETRDGRDYSGPLVSVWVSAGTAAEGDTVYVTLQIETDLPEGPIHRVLRLAVTERGM
ncbi:MAG: hypothetical protein MUF57_01135 [Gammaproteobacteria bacterium]|jgi:hypothetical protein|nr:hypothetical protein [Gammaproteobacteria bacterium]